MKLKYDEFKINKIEQKNKFLHKNGETAKEKEKKYILIVDDEAIIRDLVSDVLKENDYDILTAANGEEGLEIYKKNQQIIDLIILDIIMPGISGGELFKLIREINPDMKIIITSGYSKQKVTKTIMASGANGFLPKPFNINKLLELVNTTI